MKQWIPTVILNASVAFAVFMATNMYYREKYLRYLEDYRAMRIVHMQLVQDTETLHREFRQALSEITAGR